MPCLDGRTAVCTRLPAAHRRAPPAGCVASSKGRPTTCRPIGRPFCEKPHGTETAGSPSTLNSRVNPSSWPRATGPARLWDRRRQDRGRRRDQHVDTLKQLPRNRSISTRRACCPLQVLGGRQALRPAAAAPARPRRNRRGRVLQPALVDRRRLRDRGWRRTVAVRVGDLRDRDLLDTGAPSRFQTRERLCEQPMPPPGATFSPRYSCAATRPGAPDPPVERRWSGLASTRSGRGRVGRDRGRRWRSG